MQSKMPRLEEGLPPESAVALTRNQTELDVVTRSSLYRN